MKKRIGIIGSGISGLSASIRLSNMGYQVEVFEANGYPGGKLTSFKLGDYRFDAGPPFSQCLNMLTNSSIYVKKPGDFFNYKKKILFVNITGKMARNSQLTQKKKNF